MQLEQMFSIQTWMIFSINDRLIVISIQHYFPSPLLSIIALIAIALSVGVLVSHCYQTLCGSDAWSCLATWPGPTSLKIIPVLYKPAYRLPAPRNWRQRPGRPRHTWLRTVEEDLCQFNLGLASGLRRAQNRTAWWTLTGTATSPTSSDWLHLYLITVFTPSRLHLLSKSSWESVFLCNFLHSHPFNKIFIVTGKSHYCNDTFTDLWFTSLLAKNI